MQQVVVETALGRALDPKYPDSLRIAAAVSLASGWWFYASRIDDYAERS